MARHPNSLPKKNDEQSALNKILHETATNIIDVSALDSHDLEQHEYYERMKAYNARLNGLVRWSPPNQSKLLLIDVPAPEKLLASEPISVENLNMVIIVFISIYPQLITPKSYFEKYKLSYPPFKPQGINLA